MSKVLLVFRDLRTRQSEVLWELVLWKEHQGVLVFGFEERVGGKRDEGLEVGV